MKPVRSAENERIRRELAQLLRRLRAIRRDNRSEVEAAKRLETALAEAGSLRRFVQLTKSYDGSSRGGRWKIAVDKRNLCDAGLAQRGIIQPEDRIAS